MMFDMGIDGSFSCLERCAAQGYKVWWKYAERSIYISSWGEMNLIYMAKMFCICLYLLYLGILLRQSSTSDLLAHLEQPFRKRNKSVSDLMLKLSCIFFTPFESEKRYGYLYLMLKVEGNVSGLLSSTRENVKLASLFFFWSRGFKWTTIQIFFLFVLLSNSNPLWNHFQYFWLLLFKINSFDHF